jgi:hypothetical protein
MKRIGEGHNISDSMALFKRSGWGRKAPVVRPRFSRTEPQRNRLEMGTGDSNTTRTKVVEPFDMVELTLAMDVTIQFAVSKAHRVSEALKI